MKKSKAKKKTQKQPLHPRFVKLMYLSADLSHITDYISDREHVTVKSMQQRNLTKNEVREDIKYIWNMIYKTKESARQIRDGYPEFWKEKMRGILVTLGLIHGPINKAHFKFELLNWPKDKDLFYKHTRKAYRKANEHRHRLERLSSELAVLADEKYDSLSDLVVEKEIKNRNITTKVQKTDDSLTDQPTLEGTWTKPMSKREMMDALGIDGYKKFNTWIKNREYKIELISRKVYQLCVDKMDETSRKKLLNK